MLDRIILLPYFLSLKLRHLLYDKGTLKVNGTSVPSIGIGNITVGGTGKTPHTEMILRMLLEDERWRGKNIAVLSLGYKRATRGFQQVTVDGSASDYGDEPLQIKKKFPFVTVAVDSDRVEGCRFLCDPSSITSKRKNRRCLNPSFPAADLIVLDDSFQYRALKPGLSVVLVDYNRPIFKDRLLPLGRLRDLPERIRKADIVIVSKCPAYLDEEERASWRKNLRLRDTQELYFTGIAYSQMEPVFPEGESRYIFSKRLVLFTGIANDRPLKQFLSGTYKVVKHLKYPDHHKFSERDISEIARAADEFPTAIVTTTEKDSLRVKDMHSLPESLRTKLFRAPISIFFLTDEERDAFRESVLGRL